MSTTTITMPLTVREFAEMAHERGMTFVELLEEMGIPTETEVSRMASV